MSGFGQRRPCQRMESIRPAVASVFWRHRRTQEDDCGRNFKGPIEGSPLCCPLRFSANSSSIIPSYDPLPVVSISEVNGDGFVGRGPVASSSLGWASHLGSMSRFRPAPDGLVTAADGQKRAKSSRPWNLTGPAEARRMRSSHSEPPNDCSLPFSSLRELLTRELGHPPVNMD